MSWSSPYEWTAGEVVTAAKLNEQLYYNMRYVKGLDGVVTVASGVVIDNTDGDEYLKLPLLTTAECTSVLNAEGEVAFDEQTHRVKFYDNNSIVSVVGTDDVDDTPADAATTDPISSNWAYDHVAAADPHTGYLLESLADAAGDMIYASGDNVWVKLTKGLSGQVLTQGASIPAWAGQNVIVFSTAELFAEAAAPTSFTDLDISGTVGSNQAVCLIKVTNSAGDATALTFDFRKDDDGDTFLRGVSTTNSQTVADGHACYLIIVTDASGVVEWKANSAKNTIITMEAYLV